MRPELEISTMLRTMGEVTKRAKPFPPLEILAILDTLEWVRNPSIPDEEILGWIPYGSDSVDYA